MGIFNWFETSTKNIKEKIKVKSEEDVIRDWYLRSLDAKPDKTSHPNKTFRSETVTIDDITKGLTVGKVRDLNILYKSPRDLDILRPHTSLNYMVVDLLRYSEVKYPNNTKVGDHYYVDGNYLSKCTYNFYTLFINNPHRFKLINTKEKGSEKLLDTKTGVIFEGDYCKNTLLYLVITPMEFNFLIKTIEEYYYERYVRLTCIKRAKERKKTAKILKDLYGCCVGGKDE